MPPTASPHPRPRGAPLGNKNALKHGFYASRMPRADVKDLESCTFDGLTEEIAVMRVAIRRVIELSAGAKTFPEALDLLRILSLASLSLTRLVRAQQLISPPQNSFELALSQAITEVAAELGRPAPPHDFSPAP
jgi:hypothetical protein